MERESFAVADEPASRGVEFKLGSLNSAKEIIFSGS
jgi:hypothetical protein